MNLVKLVKLGDSFALINSAAPVKWLYLHACLACLIYYWGLLFSLFHISWHWPVTQFIVSLAYVQLVSW